MPTIVAGAPYVTLVNLFRVAPADQLGLTRVQLGDIYWYGNQQPGNISANFHRSLDGVRVFNYGQWASVEALGAGRGSEDFQAHLRNMRFFDFTVEPTLYRVEAIVGAERLVLDRDLGLLSRLTVAEVDSGESGTVVKEWERALGARVGQPGFVGAALHVALDGSRVTEYSQWRDRDSAEAEPHDDAREFDAWLAGRATAIDSHLYEIAGSGDDRSPQ